MPDDTSTTPNAEGQVDSQDAGNDGGGNDDGNVEGAKDGLSQAEVNALVAREKAKAKAKAERETRAAVEAEAKRANETEADKRAREAEERATRAEGTISKAQTLALKANGMIAAQAAGVRPERVTAVVNLTLNGADSDEYLTDDGEVDETALTDAIKATVKEYQEFTVAGSKQSIGGKTPKNGDSGGDADAVTQDQFNAMSYSERAELYQRDKALFDRLSAA